MSLLFFRLRATRDAEQPLNDEKCCKMDDSYRRGIPRVRFVQEDEDRRRVEAETALIEARQRAESAAEERRRQEEAERTKKDLQEAEALRRKKDAAAKAEAERQRLEVAALEEAALRQQQALHTPIGRWLKMEAHYNDTQASRFCAGLEELGISNTHALKAQERDAQQQLALDLNMNR